MTDPIMIGSATIHVGNNLEILPTLPDNSVHAIVTDPPYELGFMGKQWDSTGIAYNTQMWAQCLRVLKPGGHLLAFGGSRTWHRLAVAIEDAGFQIRDSIAWLYGSGFPKSLNIAKTTDDPAWKGWGTALKPAHEPIVVARKPVEGTVAQNVLTYETGGLNIDACRIGTEVRINNGMSSLGVMHDDDWQPKEVSSEVVGRWPANIILDEYTAKLLDEQTAELKGAKTYVRATDATGLTNINLPRSTGTQQTAYGDTGGASRFFYVAKASKRDRNEGLNAHLHGADSKPQQNIHPTVKPTTLMRYLIKLVTPAGGVVLDPFTGSGSTGKAALLDGYRFIGIELTPEYVPIIEGRLQWAHDQWSGQLL